MDCSPARRTIMIGGFMAAHLLGMALVACAEEPSASSFTFISDEPSTAAQQPANRLRGSVGGQSELKVVASDSPAFRAPAGASRSGGPALRPTAQPTGGILSSLGDFSPKLKMPSLRFLSRDSEKPAPQQSKQTELKVTAYPQPTAKQLAAQTSKKPSTIQPVAATQPATTTAPQAGPKSEIQPVAYVLESNRGQELQTRQETGTRLSALEQVKQNAYEGKRQAAQQRMALLSGHYPQSAIANNGARAAHPASGTLAGSQPSPNPLDGLFQKQIRQPRPISRPAVATAARPGQPSAITRTQPATRSQPAAARPSPAAQANTAQGNPAARTNGRPTSAGPNTELPPDPTRFAGQATGTPITASTRRMELPGQPATHTTTALPATPVTPAHRRVVEIMTQIHSQAGQAQTVEEYTYIVASCRRALAVESEGEVADYAKNMAAWALNRRGQERADAGEEKLAMLDFEDALRLDDTCWRALHNRAVLRAQQGEFEAAFDDLNRCTELNPNFAKAYSNRAVLFVQAGDLLSALQDYRRAIQLDPDLAVAHKGRGRVCHMLGSLEEALYHFDAAALLSPEDAHVIACRADLLSDMGHYTDAARGYQQAIELDPTLCHAYRSSAWLLATCPDSAVRDAEQAIKQANKALELDNNQNAIGLDTLAAALASAGQYQQAVTTMQEVMSLAPEEERPTYEHRLKLYRSSQPFRIQPVSGIVPVGYEQ